MPHCLDDLLILPWNDFDAVAESFAEYGDSIAGVITEPMMLNAGAIEPAPGYLDLLRRETQRAGALLIFDEIITGFRLALGGAVEVFDVIPDLAVYGKAIAGGWPVAAIAGRRDLMDMFASGDVNHSGTFNGSVMAAAAVSATIDHLVTSPPYARISALGDSLIMGLEAVSAEHSLGLQFQGRPQAFHASFGSTAARNSVDLVQADDGRYRRFAHHLAEHGVWVAARGVWYLSAAHDEHVVAITLNRFRQAARTFR